MNRITKQILYGIIFVIILMGIIIVCVFPKTEDNISDVPTESQRQNLRILSFDEIPSSTGLRSDYAIKIFNPNNSFGASVIKYSMDSQKGKTYALPLEKKYIIIVNEKKGLEEENFSIGEIIWVRISNSESENLIAQNKQYSGDEKSAVSATISNESDYDFLKVDIDVILYNTNDDPIAVSYSQLDNVLSHEKRFFETMWPQRLNDNVSNVYFQVSSNIMDEENKRVPSN